MIRDPGNPDRPLLLRLRQELDRVLAEALGADREVALVNFPNHSNPGDSALWLGAVSSLKRIGVRIRYRSAWDTFEPELLRRRLPEGPILINGGGNFGDLYAGQQGLRERLLAQCRDRRLIQLPQSVHFREQGNLDRNRRLVAEHGRVTLIARDRAAYDLMSEQFEATVKLAPDAAFGLGPLAASPHPPTRDVMWLHRRPGDPEFVDHGIPADQWTEWLEVLADEPQWRPEHRLARKSNRKLRERLPGGRSRRLLLEALERTYDGLGWGYTRRGIEILGRAETLVTDKLHGHILALLIGKPHIVLDNSYGKVSALHRTWTADSVLARFAADPDEVAELIAADRTR